ncbi:hypothetical protein TNCV_3735811 [Trichonephila clavipes]|nr:hypothetical protein TNCV_3735811 [Trichonephila clavipes]
MSEGLLKSNCEPMRMLLVTDLAILSLGQVTWVVSELPPFQTTALRQRRTLYPDKVPQLLYVEGFQWHNDPNSRQGS